MPPKGKNHNQSKPAQSGKPIKPKQAGPPKSIAKPSIIQKLDDWFKPRLNLFFFISLILTVLCGALLFDVKISTGGDDSHYIEMANDYIRGRSFPSWHGPLYSIFLSLPILIMGVNVVVLKLFSFVFVIAHLVLFYYTFRKHLSPTLLAIIMLIIGVNSTILYFASQTYSEAMYMFLQSAGVFLFIQTYLALEAEPDFTLKDQLLYWLMIGLFVFLASLTRNIGIVALLVMVVFLLLNKKYLSSILLLGSYIVFLLPYKLYKALVWDAGRPKGSSQFGEILLKNPYNRAEGTEDFTGMVVRYFENARLYLSKHFMVGIGLQDPTDYDKSWFITLLVGAIILIALVYAFRKNRVMLFIGLYLIASASATFIALQQSWDQMRMVVIYIPMLLVLMSWGLLQLSTRKGLGFIAILLPLVLVFIFFKTFDQTAEKMKTNQKVLSRNLKGNLYYGFTPDWQNFLVMSKWVGQNLPDSVVVASRKPSMSYVYSGGRDFYGMYRFPVEEPKKLVDALGTRVGDMVVIPDKNLDSSCPPDVKQRLKASVVGYVAEGTDVYGLYRTASPEGDAVKQAIADFNMTAVTPDSLLRRVRVSAQKCFAVSPDTLIRTLRRNRVSYVIVASLRANPNMNTGNIINNIQRYLYFVELKYPGILSLEHQIGATEAEEPAWLYKLNYQIYGL
jgi:hypothetical protein